MGLDDQTSVANRCYFSDRYDKEIHFEIFHVLRNIYFSIVTEIISLASSTKKFLQPIVHVWQCILLNALVFLEQHVVVHNSGCDDFDGMHILFYFPLIGHLTSDSQSGISDLSPFDPLNAPIVSDFNLTVNGLRVYQPYTLKTSQLLLMRLPWKCHRININNIIIILL